MSFNYFAASLLLGVAFCLSAKAQTTIIFDSHERPLRSKKKHAAPDGKAVITLGLASYVEGYTPMHYEQRISSFFSIAAGAGVSFRSYTTDLGLLVWQEGYNSDFRLSGPGYYSDVEEDYASYKFRKSTTGSYFSISPKFYPNDDALDGLYFAPAVEFVQYRFTNRLADETPFARGFYPTTNADAVPRTNALMTEKMNCLDLTFNSGGVFQAKGHIALSWNIGLGLRHESAERLDIVMVDNGVNAQYVNSVHNYSKNKPLMTFNFAIGGWF